MTWQSRNLPNSRFDSMPRPEEPSQTHFGFEAYYHSERAQFWLSLVWLSRSLNCATVVSSSSVFWGHDSREDLHFELSQVDVCKDFNLEDKSHSAMNGRTWVESRFARAWIRFYRCLFKSQDLWSLCLWRISLCFTDLDCGDWTLSECRLRNITGAQGALDFATESGLFEAQDKVLSDLSACRLPM